MKKNKKNLKAVSLIIVIALMLFFVPKVYKRMRVLKGISGKEKTLFFSHFNDNTEGTFKYDMLTGSMAKVCGDSFSDLHYSNDRKRIIGCVWTDYFLGFAELELSNNEFKPIISLDELNTLLSDMGLDKIDYKNGLGYGFRIKYYKSGYTLYNDNRKRKTLLYIEKTGDSWSIEKIYENEYGSSDYFILEGDEEDTLLIQIKEEDRGNHTSKGGIIKKGLRTGKTEYIKNLYITSDTFKRGGMDITEDKSKIVYYEEPYIYVYNLKTGQTEKTVEVKRDNPENEEVIYIRFSPDGKHLFYALREYTHFIEAMERWSFYAVNLETTEIVKLKKWRYKDSFAGFDW